MKSDEKQIFSYIKQINDDIKPDTTLKCDLLKKISNKYKQNNHRKIRVLRSIFSFYSFFLIIVIVLIIESIFIYSIYTKKIDIYENINNLISITLQNKDDISLVKKNFILIYKKISNIKNKEAKKYIWITFMHKSALSFNKWLK